jgi:pimeloyl-ACP methyl ester carboxylesterase
MASRTHLRRTAALLAIGLLGTFGAAAPAFAGPDPVAAHRPRLVDPGPCAGVANFTCAYLTVPLDHAGTKPGRLRLRVAVADNAAAPRGALVVLTGGPGEPGASVAAQLVPSFAGLLHDYRLVLVDQRGTAAGAIDCPRLSKEVGASDALAPSAGAVTECADAFGDTRNFATTADTVADLDDLRRALDVPRWTVDGISYGTFVAERYALTHPGRVSRLVLDSVVPAAGMPALYADSLRRTGWVLRQACAEQRCGFDPAADLATVVRRDGNGVGVLNLLQFASMVDPRLTGQGFVPVLWLLHESAIGDPVPLDGTIQALSADDGTPRNEYSAGLHAATLCADLDGLPWGDASAPLAGRDAAVRRTLSTVDANTVWPFEPRTAVEQGFVATCRYWPPSRPDPKPRFDRLTMPVLLLAGDRDVATPVDWARSVAAQASRAQLVVVPGMGHVIQGRDATGDAAVRQFLLGRAW